eukprot:357968-Chlamydomonas_euryale.AAC.2
MQAGPPSQRPCCAVNLSCGRHEVRRKHRRACTCQEEKVARHRCGGPSSMSVHGSIPHVGVGSCPACRCGEPPRTSMWGAVPHVDVGSRPACRFGSRPARRCGEPSRRWDRHHPDCHHQHPRK